MESLYAYSIPALREHGLISLHLFKDDRMFLIFAGGRRKSLKCALCESYKTNPTEEYQNQRWEKHSQEEVFKIFIMHLKKKNLSKIKLTFPD